ncbi:hypothetical protein MRX96_051580 [Rhipicephalus microplus]
MIELYVNFASQAHQGGAEEARSQCRRAPAHLRPRARMARPTDAASGAGMLATPSENFVIDSCSREASVRVPRLVHDAGQGYLEDRRPGANVEPYSATAAIVKTVCL